MSTNNKPSNFQKFISYYKPYKVLFAVNILAAVLTAAFALTLPLLVRHITVNILGSGAANVLPQILTTGAIMVAIIIAQTGTGLFNDWMGHILGARIERGLRAELFAHYQKLPFSFYDNRNTGELMSRLTNDLFSLSETYHHVPIMATTFSLQFAGSIVILLYINWRLAILIFIVLIGIGVYIAIFYKKLQVSYKVNQERIADINAAAQENLSGIRIAKNFANEAVEIEKFSAQNNRFYDSRANIYKNEALLFSFIEYMFTPLITVIIVVMGGVWIAGGSLEIASLLVFVMYTAYLLGPVPKMAELLPFFQSGFIGFVRFQEIMNTDVEISDAENAIELNISHGNVEFENVAFRYSPEHEYILQDINLVVQQGETVAIVGRSGIGKSTLCSLIPRLYDVSDGAVRINGVDVRDITQHSLRKHIGVVEQETFLFAGTVMENILYGKPDATPEEAMEAAKNANAHDFIMALPNGYSTDIGQRGIKLSGGQRQRLSIARVFLKNPPILILDEATSALDMESEKVVMESLDALAVGRTTFVIAHRLSTVQNADRIIEIKELTRE